MNLIEIISFLNLSGNTIRGLQTQRKAAENQVDKLNIQIAQQIFQQWFRNSNIEFKIERTDSRKYLTLKGRIPRLEDRLQKAIDQIKHETGLESRYFIVEVDYGHERFFDLYPTYPTHEMINLLLSRSKSTQHSSVLWERTRQDIY